MILMLAYQRAFNFTLRNRQRGARQSEQHLSLDERKKSVSINFCSTSIGFHSNLSPCFNWSLLAHHKNKKRRRIVMRFTSLFAQRKGRREKYINYFFSTLVFYLYHFPLKSDWETFFFISEMFDYNTKDLNGKRFIEMSNLKGSIR